MRVALGRWTRSISASSLGVSGPWRSIVARAAVWEGPRFVPASCRRRRAVLVMTSRRCAASSLSSPPPVAAGRVAPFTKVVAIGNYDSELLRPSALAKPRELSPGPRVRDLGGGEPGAPRRGDAKDHILERGDAMGVRVDADHHPGLRGQAGVALGEVPAVG